MENSVFKKNIFLLFIGEIISTVALLSVFGSIPSVNWMHYIGLIGIVSCVIEIIVAVRLRKLNDGFKSAFWAIIISKIIFVLGSLFSLILDLAGRILYGTCMMVYIIASIFATDYIFQGCAIKSDLEENFGKKLYMSYAILMMVYFVLTLILIFDFANNDQNLLISLDIAAICFGMAAHICFVVFLGMFNKMLSKEE